MDAPGFLPRRTTIDLDRVVTLWSVADEAEAEAVRQMVYERGDPRGPVLYPPTSRALTVYLPLEHADLAPAWRVEAADFGPPLGLRYEIAFGADDYDPDRMTVSFGPGGCDPVPAWGFCQEPAPRFKTFSVSTERAHDPRTIRRVLASWFLGPGPRPGLMHAEAPADELSPLESQTILMILKRRRPNRWPDTDR